MLIPNATKAAHGKNPKNYVIRDYIIPHQLPGFRSNPDSRSSGMPLPPRHPEWRTGESAPSSGIRPSPRIPEAPAPCSSECPPAQIGPRTLIDRKDPKLQTKKQRLPRKDIRSACSAPASALPPPLLSFLTVHQESESHTQQKKENRRRHPTRKLRHLVRAARPQIVAQKGLENVALQHNQRRYSPHPVQIRKSL